MIFTIVGAYLICGFLVGATLEGASVFGRFFVALLWLPVLLLLLLTVAVRGLANFLENLVDRLNVFWNVHVQP